MLRLICTFITLLTIACGEDTSLSRDIVSQWYLACYCDDVQIVAELTPELSEWKTEAYALEKEEAIRARDKISVEIKCEILPKEDY